MQNWARCNKVLAYEVFFLRSNWIYLLRYLLNPRYNHDKIRREFRQQRQKIGILHFHCGGYFFCFSGIIFLTQKAPADHISVKDRGLLLLDSIRSGEMEQLSHSTESASPSRFLTTPGVPDAAFSCCILAHTAS